MEIAIAFAVCLLPPAIITASMGGKMCLLVGTILMPILLK